MSKLEALRAENPGHATYVDGLIERVQDRENGGSLAAEVAILNARHILSPVEVEILEEVFPGGPTASESERIRLIWG